MHNFFFYIAHRFAWFQPNRINCENSSKVNNILQGSTIQHFRFCENDENSSYLFLTYRIYAKSFYVLCLYISKLLKIKKMFDRRSLINVTLNVRAKFHSNRLVIYRDILHNVSKNLSFAFKLSKRHFSYVSSTYFFFTCISRLAVLTIHN